MKLTKEDINTFATAKEQKMLLEANDPFEVPAGDEQDQSLPEDETPMEDEQEAGTDEEENAPLTDVTIPYTLAEDLFEFLLDADFSDSEESSVRDNLLVSLAEAVGFEPYKY